MTVRDDTAKTPSETGTRSRAEGRHTWQDNPSLCLRMHRTGGAVPWQNVEREAHDETIKQIDRVDPPGSALDLAGEPQPQRCQDA